MDTFKNLFRSLKALQLIKHTIAHNCLIKGKVNRDSTIDMMKGLGILLVVIGHVSENTLINKWIYSFHMPAFFFISGCVCHISKEKSDFLKKKVRSLLIPYLILSITTFSYWATIERSIRGQEHIAIIGQLIGIFIAQGGNQNYTYNIVMWFLPCLFICEITFYAIRKLIHKKILICFTLLILSMLGFTIGQYIKFRLPWSMDTMLIAIVFYGAGYLSYEKIKDYKFNVTIKNLIFLTTLSMIHIYFVLQFYAGCDMNGNFYSRYFFLCSFGGIGFMYMSAKMINLKLIKYLGINSLIIMGIHEPVKRIVIKITNVIMQIDIHTLRQEIFWIMICTVIVLTCMYPLIIIIENINQLMKNIQMKKDSV